MDGAAILFILALAGVAAIFLFALKGLLDQLPDVIKSAGNVRDEWDRFRKKRDNAPPPAESPPPRRTRPSCLPAQTTRSPLPLYRPHPSPRAHRPCPPEEDETAGRCPCLTPPAAPAACVRRPAATRRAPGPAR
ncbi:hypothetical protein GCM10020295_10480 [Streptomyces cinereospinus]